VARAKEYHQKGDDAKSFAEADKAIKLNPQSAWAWCVRGEASNSLNNYQSAIDDCTKALQLDAKLGWAYTVRGVARGRARQVDQGIADLSEALRLDPGDTTALFNRAWFYSLKGDLDRAIADYDSLLKLRPGIANLYLERGKLHARKGDDVRARADFAEAVKRDKSLASKVPPSKPPAPALPALVWPAAELQAGKILAPDLSKTPPWLTDNFRNLASGLPKDASRGYLNGHYFLKVSGVDQVTAEIPMGRANPPNPRGAFACEVVGKVTGVGGRWGLEISDEGKPGVAVTIAAVGIVSLRTLSSKTRQLDPGTHPAIKKGVPGKGLRNRLLLVVRGRYLEVYVNNRAVPDPILLKKEIATPQIALLCRAQRARGAIAEFDSIIVKPAGSLPPLEKRGAKPREK
jgi:hypothetical protein